MSKANLDNLSDSTGIFSDFSLKEVFKEGIKSLNVGKTITDSITEKYLFVPLKLKKTASVTFNIAIYTAGVAASIAFLLIFIHAAWPVITAIALAGVAAAALTTAITCISIAYHRAQQIEKRRRQLQYPFWEQWSKNPNMKQILNKTSSLEKQAYSDQQTETHTEEAKQNLEKIKTALQNSDGINKDAINQAIEILSKNTIFLLSIVKVELGVLSMQEQAQQSAQQFMRNSIEPITPPDYLNDICSEDSNTVQNGIKAALGLDKILQKENGGSQQSKISKITDNIEIIEQQIDTTARNINQNKDTLSRL
ncbi:MAG: hypothetical protein K2L13_03400 [Opitutales bacterium]|nr:hypothetical protein [Opitutales bacterium]